MPRISREHLEGGGMIIVNMKKMLHITMFFLRKTGCSNEMVVVRTKMEQYAKNVFERHSIISWSFSARNKLA